MMAQERPLAVPILRSSVKAGAHAADQDDGLAYTLDHNEFSMQVSSPTCESAVGWLVLFVGSGICLGMFYEALFLHAGPAAESSQLVPLLGYLGTAAVGGVYCLASRSWRQGRWTRAMVGWLALSSVANGVAQASDYVALKQAGQMLYTILHSSVTFFACLIAFVCLRTRITPAQWAGCLLVVLGLVITATPSTVDAQESFWVGLASAGAGALCLAASYPLAELIFRSASVPPAEEFCSFAGALLNVLLFGTWTLSYTYHRWDELVIQPIHRAAQPSVPLAVTFYAMHALTVGVHTLAFWKTMRSLGTVPTAISKGAQQAGNFLFAHIFFCKVDPRECITGVPTNVSSTPPHTGPSAWHEAQKPAAFSLCCLGCVVYALATKRRDALLFATRTITSSDADSTTATWTAATTEAEEGSTSAEGGSVQDREATTPPARPR